MVGDKIKTDDHRRFFAAPRLASPQEILEESRKVRPAPAREAGVVWAQNRAELDMHVVALGQQGHRIVNVVLDDSGYGYHIVWQEWG